MHPAELRASALSLVEEGCNDMQVAARLGLPRTTVRDWRRPPYVRARPLVVCPRCWQTMRPIRCSPADYCELLGLYLGDGHTAHSARTQRLRLSLDSRYSEIVADAAALLARCFPCNRVGDVGADGGSTTVLWVDHGHLACLFPQAGAGKKHERALTFEPWQFELLEQAPWAFLRGCIRSDGCVYVNRTGRYEYLSYDFSNRSIDIADLFEHVCGIVGLQPRRYRRYTRLHRREDVARLLEHVGTKR